MDKLWEKALATLRSEVNEQVFGAWFAPIQTVKLEDSAVTLGVPNKFFENWIRDKYFNLIKTALDQAGGKNFSITFQLIDTPPAETTSETADSPETTVLSPPDSKDKPLGWLKSVFSGTKQMPEGNYQQSGLNPKYTFDSFVVGQSNRFAYAAAQAVCDKVSKTYNPLFLYGGVGLGKTHLMQSLGHALLEKHPRAKVLYMSSEEFTNQLISAIRTKTTPKFRAMYRNVDVLLIDDIQFIAGKDATQEEFFHTFNALHDAHKQIVLCSDRPPPEIPDLEERLISRFAWGLVADVQMPDFETRVAIMEKKSELEAVEVPKPVLFFLGEHIKTNIREMEGALIRVAAYSNLTGEPMTVALAKEVLKGMISAEEKKITIDLIQQVVVDFFDIKASDMKTKKRSRAVAYPRQIAMYLSRNLTDHSFPDIGGFFGGRDHTTVLHAFDKISKEVASNETTKNIVDKIIIKIKG